MRPAVSVIIPTYNRRTLVGEAIGSVMAQRWAGPEFTGELIVVDDGSTDGTAAELDRLAGEVKARTDDRVRMHVLRTENRGVAAARNRGVAIAQAPLLAFLDSDDLWLPQKLERQLQFMRAHPQYEIGQTEEIWMRGGRRVNPGLRHRKRAGDIFIDSLRTCLISPSAVIVSRELFRELGGFDERMPAAEDYDLWLRILVNHEAGLIAEPLVIRRADSMLHGNGEAGQLSATVPAIDRFRILALLKLIAGELLDSERRRAVVEVMAEKCAIYAQGLERRGRAADAIAVAKIAARVNADAGEPSRAWHDDSIAKLVGIITAESSGAGPEASGATKRSAGSMEETPGEIGDGNGAMTEAAE